MSDIEKLTEDEREAVRRGTCQASGPKALRIIDAHEADRAALVEQLGVANARADAAERALELTREHNDDLRFRCSKVESERDAAKARIAELETQLRYRCPALVAELAAANARADGLRTALEDADANARRAVEQLQRDAATEAAALRAELAEARALLVRVDEAMENEGPWLVLQSHLRAFLAANPVSPRAAAERAVLDAMAAADIGGTEDGRCLTYTCAHIEAACRAELALRAVAK